MDPMVNQKPASSRIQFLDGLRGVAALLVVYGHVVSSESFASPFRAIHPAGVWMFFVLSSFLLTFLLYRRLVNDRKRRFPIRRTLGEYAIRRFMRVYPLYFIVCMFLKVAPNWTPPGSLLGPAFHNWEALFLVRSPSLAWTIPIEMQSYLLLPIIVFSVDLAGKLWILPTLVIAIFANVRFIFYKQFDQYFYATASLLECLPLFLDGAVAAIIFVKFDEFISARCIRYKYPKLYSIAGTIGDILCWVLFTMFLLISIPDFYPVFGILAQESDPRYQAPICATILCLAMLFQRSFTRFFEWSFFVHCGKVSFGMYLTHFWPVWCHRLVLKWYGDEGFISILIMAIALSTIIYSTIEIRIQSVTTKLIKCWHKWC